MNSNDYNYDYLNHQAHYGRGYDEYNFDIDIMNDSGDLINLIKQAKDCEEGIENGAVVVFTEKQYITAFNRGMGNGPHNATFARIYSLLTDKKELGFFSVMQYCHKLEDTLIHARIYSEKETRMSKVNNIISFSFNRDKKISQKEYESFLAFYNEYAWLIKRENFKVSLMGRDRTIDEIKDYFESIVDYDFNLSSIFEENDIIGINMEGNGKVR